MQHFAVANFFSSIVLCKGFFGKLSCKKSHFGSAIMGYSWPKSFVCMPYFWSTHLSLETCLNFSRGILFTNAQHLLCCYTLHIWGVALLICCIFFGAGHFLYIHWCCDRYVSDTPHQCFCIISCHLVVCQSPDNNPPQYGQYFLPMLWLQWWFECIKKKIAIRTVWFGRVHFS